jgi:hypothetical protein
MRPSVLRHPPSILCVPDFATSGYLGEGSVPLSRIRTYLPVVEVDLIALLADPEKAYFLNENH